MTVNERVIVFDTTLGEGERSPGYSLNLDERLRMARQLEHLRVDVLDAGTPMNSAGEFEAVRLIAKTIESAAVAAACRPAKPDIDRTWEAIQRAKHPRLCLLVPVQEALAAGRSRKSIEQIIDEASGVVRYATSLCPEVEVSCDDASRTGIDLLSRMVAAVIEAGATIVSLPDSVGYATPEEYGEMFRVIRESVTTASTIRLGAHCHNDLGMAVANSLAALRNGAREVICTINGIGERAGCASLEEVVMALEARQETLKLQTNVNASELYKSSRLLSSLTGVPVQRNKPVVGSNAFAYHAGIEHDDHTQSRLRYQPITPQSVGIKHSAVFLGKHSDRHALQQRYAELGYDLPASEVDRAFQVFRQIAEQKKEIFDEDLVAILDDRVGSEEELYQLEDLQVHSGTTLRPTATVGLRRGTQRFVDSATGDGPVDAAYKAIERVTGMAGELTEYTIKSISLGRDAIGEVFVRVNFQGMLFNGRGLSTDVITGSVKAYLEALNRALLARERKAQERS